MIRPRGSISGFAAGSRRSSPITGAKSSCSTSCFSRCRARRCSTTATRSGWAIISTSAIATAAAPRCSGAAIRMPVFRKRIRSSFTCRSRLIPSTTTRRSTSRPSKRICRPFSGGRAASSRCGKTSALSPAARSSSFFPITPRCSLFCVATRTRPSSWSRICRAFPRRRRSICHASPVARRWKFSAGTFSRRSGKRVTC